MTPADPTQSGHAQTLQLLGTGFHPGIAFLFVDPNGEQVTVREPNVQNLQFSSADVSVTLWQAGRHTLTAVQANGERSAPFVLVVRDRRAAGSAIDNISPASTVRSSAAQVVSLSGRNFDPCLVVQIIDPDSLVSRLEAPQLRQSTETLMEFSKVFDKVGTYRISLWTNLGPASSTVVVEVGSGGQVF